MPFLPPNQQRQSTEGTNIFYHTSKILQTNKKTRKINFFNGGKLAGGREEMRKGCD